MVKFSLHFVLGEKPISACLRNTASCKPSLTLFIFFCAVPTLDSVAWQHWQGKAALYVWVGILKDNENTGVSKCS